MKFGLVQCVSNELALIIIAVWGFETSYKEQEAPSLVTMNAHWYISMFTTNYGCNRILIRTILGAIALYGCLHVVKQCLLNIIL
jgi:hypothetical protein